MEEQRPGPIITDSRDSGLRERDVGRLDEQRAKVWEFMMKQNHLGRWTSLAELSGAVGAPEASVSARLRDFRKRRYGSHLVEKRRRRAEGNTYEYRVVV